MKTLKSEWDKMINEFNGLTYEERLEYWIEKKFYKIHHCKFDSNLAVKQIPAKQKKIIGKKGEFSIYPQTELESELYINFIVDNLDLFPRSSESTGIYGLNHLMEVLLNRLNKADKPEYLFNEELAWVKHIMENSHHWGGGDLYRGNYDASTGLPLIEFKLDPFGPINYFYYFGVVLSKYELEIHKLKSGEMPSGNFSQLNLTERLILIEILRFCDSFPPKHAIQVKNYEFLTTVLNASIDQIENSSKKTENYFFKKITKGQKPAFLKSANKVKVVLLELGNETFIKKINEVLTRIEQVD